MFCSLVHILIYISIIITVVNPVLNANRIIYAFVNSSFVFIIQIYSNFRTS